MANIETERQLSFADTSEEYRAFVEKFKPKKTTDDCYTPEPIYEVVKNWACDRYHIDPSAIVRPFWPGSDYQAFDYQQGCVVLDNPPFSILRDIVEWYLKNNIHFFLFMPSLTGLHLGGEKCCKIYVSGKIIYENGANVNTSFITNLDGENVAMSEPTLRRLIDECSEKLKRQSGIVKTLPTYEYPMNVLTAARCDHYSRHGVEFAVKRGQSLFIRSLDEMRKAKKEIWGGGLLLSTAAAKERERAEKEAARNIAAGAAKKEDRGNVYIWKISDQEQEVIAMLNRKEAGQ